MPLDSLTTPATTISTLAGFAAGTPQREFANEFQRLISLTGGGIEMSTTDFDTWSPSQIAALQGAWYLPAPIQRLTSTVGTKSTDTNVNYRSSGFYDGRERRWITMLQTNIKSLVVWNRDGVYMDDTTTEDLAMPYKSDDLTKKNTAFNTTTGNSTNNLAFLRETNQAKFTPPLVAGSFQALGLGSSDLSEGGLVFHATVADDLSGNGVSDVTTVSPVYQKDRDGTDKLDPSGNRIILDRFRNYQPLGERQSPFGFAFNGGDFLPAPLTLVTDQGIYIQGDFNNNSQPQQTSAATPVPPNGFRLPAAIMADTIAILSNQCVATTSTLSNAATLRNHLGVLAGQISCGLPRAITGAIDPINGPELGYYGVNGSGTTAVNAAFLSSTDRSIGNCKKSSGAYTCGVIAPAKLKDSGGLNNYMRMLERWNGIYFNYSGSFVSLGDPLEYSGEYVIGTNRTVNNKSYYSIPSRNFNFDEKFRNFTGLPPLTPRAVNLQQEVFKRTFN